MRNWVEIWTNLKTILSQLPSIQVKDGIEILIIAYLIYQIMQWFWGTKAWTLFKGILILLAIFAFASLMEFNTILWIFANTINVGIIAVFIVFQPELRRALEQLGRSNFFGKLLNLEEVRRTGDDLNEEQINDIVQAAEEMGKVKTGALIVLEQTESLSEYIRSGIPLDAVVSKEFLSIILPCTTAPSLSGAAGLRRRPVICRFQTICPSAKSWAPGIGRDWALAKRRTQW